MKLKQIIIGTFLLILGITSAYAENIFKVYVNNSTPYPVSIKLEDNDQAKAFIEGFESTFCTIGSMATVIIICAVDQWVDPAYDIVYQFPSGSSVEQRINMGNDHAAQAAMTSGDFYVNNGPILSSSFDSETMAQGIVTDLGLSGTWGDIVTSALELFSSNTNSLIMDNTETNYGILIARQNYEASHFINTDFAFPESREPTIALAAGNDSFKIYGNGWYYYNIPQFPIPLPKNTITALGVSPTSAGQTPVYLIGTSYGLIMIVSDLTGESIILNSPDNTLIQKVFWNPATKDLNNPAMVVLQSDNSLWSYNAEGESTWEELGLSYQVGAAITQISVGFSPNKGKVAYVAGFNDGGLFASALSGESFGFAGGTGPWGSTSITALKTNFADSNTQILIGTGDGQIWYYEEGSGWTPYNGNYINCVIQLEVNFALADTKDTDWFVAQGFQGETVINGTEVIHPAKGNYALLDAYWAEGSTKPVILGGFANGVVALWHEDKWQNLINETGNEVQYIKNDWTKWTTEHPYESLHYVKCVGGSLSIHENRKFTVITKP